MRRVLMTADAVGGVWTFACELAKALGERDVEVVLALLGPPPSPAQRAQATALAHVQLYEHAGRLEWMEDPWTDVEHAGQWLRRVAEETAPDVVHLNGLCHAQQPWPVRVMVTGHSCVSSWWRAVHRVKPPAEWDRYIAEVGRSLRAADLVVAPTASMLSALDDHYGSLPATTVIPNGRSSPLVRAAEGVGAKEPIVLSAGRLWDEAKNLRTLCASAEWLDWPIYVAGDSRSPNSSHANGCCRGRQETASDPTTGADLTGAHPRTVAREFATPGDVCFLGRLEAADLAAWMNRAAIYALPARYEPFGLSILEAALAGCALVLGDIRSLREVWSDCALYVPSEDARALASAVNALIADADFRVALGTRARARAETMTATRMGAGYLAAYEALASGHEPALPERSPDIASDPLHRRVEAALPADLRL